jgi:6-phosphogluconolactonase
MRLGKWVRVALAAAPFLAGCGNFWQAPGSTGGSSCETDCSTATSGDFYILDSGTTPEVVGASIVSGTLTALSGSPWTAASTPYAMAMAPSGNYLYVSTIAGVYVYPVTSGTLGTAVQVSEDVAALAIQVDTSGTWLIEALQATGGVTLAAVPLSASSGGDNGAEQTVSYTVANGSVQNGKIAISPDDKTIFVALGAGGTLIAPFNASASGGANPFSTSGRVVNVANSDSEALSVAVDASGTLFYIGETNANSAGTSGALFAYLYSSLANASLTAATGSPIASGGLAPSAILPTSSGYVYVANGEGTGATGNISSFAVTSSGSTYTIAAGSTIAAGIQPYALATDSSGTFLLAINSLGNPYFSWYTFDSTTPGKLDAQSTANTGSSPLAIVAP